MTAYLPAPFLLDPTFQSSELKKVRTLIEYIPHNIYRRLYAIRHPAKFRNGVRKRTACDENGNTLKPYDQYKCIFVHIPKTGGSAISNSLFNGPSGGHDSILYYKRIFTHSEFYAYYKFTFVRNPWGRLLSAYHYIKESENPTEITWANKFLPSYDTFEKFVLNGITEQSIINWIHFVPQYTFICLPGTRKPLVDFIGRFEEIGCGFATIVAQLGIRDLPLVRHNVGRLGFNTYYREYYTKQMADIVGHVYSSDVELFSYAF